PLVVIGVGDQVATKALPWLARIIGERTDASVSGIVSVLVFGAGTDYALLLISRYREELRRTPDRRRALAAAVASATPAILASATTVIFALLALLAAVLTSNRTLGIASALGIAIALLFGLVVLPAALACLPRGVFWPFVPRAEPAAVQGDFIERGLWWRIAVTVARRPMAALAGATVILLAMVAMLPGLRVGLSQTEVFRTTVESVTGQEILARRFSSGTSQPLKIIAASQAEERVRQLITETAGLTPAGRAETSTDGRLVAISASLEAEAGTAEADRTINRLRDALPTIEGADAIVGGAPASDLDKREANTRDNWVTAPLILTVVFLVLLVLLRSLVAPVILLATVVGSFAASIGAGSLALRVFFDSPALDSGVPLLAFLFLVALGVDYNIFLATRAREEATALGDSRAGMTRALAATGGVITSAGILLAAVFAVLGVLPVIALTQIGVIVGIGVLLDTLVVRTVVVPAFAHLLGDRFWWPVTPSPVTRSPVTRSPAPPDPSGG
ncbi:MAG: MMPL family transporter, partial [Micromonosporaceae bacterium]|nr:MMPL family transporter [Micromonosporaceae bacterium]